MTHLHIDISDDVAETAKSRAKAAGKSLSSYLADLVVNDVADQWPEGFFEEVVGGWQGKPLDRPSQSRVDELSRCSNWS